MVLNRGLDLPQSARQAALHGPRDMKQTGSPEWCWQGIEMLRLHWSRIETQYERFEAELKELELVKAWEKIPPDHPYGSLDAMLRAEIGKPETAVRERVYELKHRGRPTLAEKGNHDNVLSPPVRGVSKPYLRARLIRDHPGIAQQLDAGAFRSVRAAAMAAGIVKVRPTVTVPLTVDGVFRAALKLSSADQDELLRLLAERAQ